MASDSSPRSSLDVPRQTAPYPSRRKSEDASQLRWSSDNERGRTRVSEQWRSHDPRSSSTQSLRPPESGRDGRRVLLLIYIHGFMGNEMSFQSFPAHVHNLLSILVSETHVLHTKIYPRYKSRKPIEYARDDFSAWLEPNESTHTDVVLLGHSMGGILAAEVALLPPHSPASGQPFRHRILGTIGFDTPYLGMHPGVIVSGIGSLFRPAPKPPTFSQNSQADPSTQHGPYTQFPTSNTSASSTGELNHASYDADPTSSPLSPTQSDTSSLTTLPSNDPNFDPPFPNDKRLTERTGWNSVLHFINKHSDGLTTATKNYFVSHLEFGGCLADYPGLRNRYAKIRELEDVDDLIQNDGPGYKRPVRRVRFVNYWTASTGIPKHPKVPPGQMMDKDGHLKPIEVEMKDMSLSDTSSRSHTPTPSISVDEYNDEGVTRRKVDQAPEHQPSAIEIQMKNLGEHSGVVEDESNELPKMQHIDSAPIEDDVNEGFQAPADTGRPHTAVEGETTTPERRESEPPLPPIPPIPPIPEEPPVIDLSIYTDKDSRRIAEKEQKRLIKVYQQAVKDRENAIKDRRKVAEKREKKSRQEREKQLKAEQKERLKQEKEEEKRRATINPPRAEGKTKVEKPKRDKKFCMMPPDVNGKRDKCWVRVYMEGVDEVGAHCGLFFPGPQYESLVGDVGARIEEWVKEDATRRVILEGETVD